MVRSSNLAALAALSPTSSLPLTDPSPKRGPGRIADCFVLAAKDDHGPLSPGDLKGPEPIEFKPPPPVPYESTKDRVTKVTDPVMDSMAMGACAAIGTVLIPGPLGTVVGAAAGAGIVALGKLLRGR